MKPYVCGGGRDVLFQKLRDMLIDARYIGEAVVQFKRIGTYYRLAFLWPLQQASTYFAHPA
jgi:hypothetical protein